MAKLEVSHVFPTPVFTFSKMEDEINNQEILQFCRNHVLKDSGKPDKKTSNFGGYQSNDLYAKYCTDSSMLKLLDVVKNRAAYCVRMLNLTGFKERMSLDFGNFWININSKGSSNFVHCHGKSFLSAVYYVKVPDNSGNIEFVTPNEIVYFWWSNYIDNPNLNESYSIFTTDKHAVKPEEGDLIIFPSWLRHGVYVNQTDEDRISIAFNIIARENDSI